MKIKFVNEPQEVYFEILNIGDCFIYDNMPHMKIQNLYETCLYPHNAILLGNGRLVRFRDDCPVYRCDATLNIKRI